MHASTLPRLALTALLATLGCSSISTEPTPVAELVKAADVEFIPLNPARGDASPQSGKLWGDIREDEPAGMLVTFRDGFSSPPHIHNITYRAVVISGEVHNDDPDAAEMWMGPGSFWTQPLGENHVTAARGETPMIFLEIASGPYLVRPAEQQFDADERPVNVDARNLLWLGADDSTWLEGAGPEIAHLWGELEGGEKNGSFVRLPAGGRAALSTDSPLLRAVTIRGTTVLEAAGEIETHRLDPGSYFGSRGRATHRLACEPGAECILYLHVEGRYALTAL